MLEELSVTNYALIDDIKLSFTKGLNILTGETGAGKSLLVGALGLIFGKKGSPSFVRQGEEEATISALVDVSGNDEAIVWLKNNNIKYEDNQVLIKRHVKDSGRGSQYIEGEAILRTQLEEFASLLFDMHGQHEHQSLFNKNNHRMLLDKFGQLTDDVINLYNKFLALGSLKNEINKLEEAESGQEERISFLKKAIKEIDSVKLEEGEEEELEKELKMLRNNDSVFSLLNSSLSLTTSSTGLVAGLKELSLNIDALSQYDESFSSLLKRVKDCFYEIDDISETINDFKRNIDFSPELLEKKEERISEIYKLEKKYGASLDDVLKFSASAKEELEKIDNSGENIEALKKQFRENQEEILENAKDLSLKREKFARSLEEKVVTQLKQLSLPNVKFVVDIGQRKDSSGKSSCGPWGIDDIEFLMSMNPGEPLKPVRQIASGGEISRIMLALKSVLSDVDNVGCLIFDEIDSGIGGEVALSIGDHLKNLSEKKQVLSITHLASIASYGNNHLKVIKNSDGVTTKTEVIKLNKDERIREIARMLSGDCSEASLNHARELLGIS
ncbi:MAG: DNA repair protein RecN [Spirochaetales bacterium]|nr:DNA repair protein RecN [Spirochaetales bacterium]